MGYDYVDIKTIQINFYTWLIRESFLVVSICLTQPSVKDACCRWQTAHLLRTRCDRESRVVSRHESSAMPIAGRVRHSGYAFRPRLAITEYSDLSEEGISMDTEMAGHLTV